MRVNNLIRHILFLCRIKDVETVAMIFLMELDVAPDYDGFDYLHKAILLFRKDPTQSISQDVYQSIADQYDRGVTASQVEQAIRRAICAAWESRSEREWQLYFPKQITKPSNGYFIAQVARLVDLWEGCCKSVKEVVYE